LSDSKPPASLDSASGIRDANRDRGHSGFGIPDAALDELLARARAVREHAHAPYSGFKVGAALETADGTIVAGCNIENATYGLTLCAERVAIFKALSDGHREFRRMVVVAPPDAPTPPCGACRQVLWECAGDLEIILANLKEETGRHRISALLPQPFDDGVLRSK
jgi:cytidine deaminase